MNKENWNEGTACAVMQVKACSKVCTGQTKNPQLKGLFFSYGHFLREPQNLLSSFKRHPN